MILSTPSLLISRGMERLIAEVTEVSGVHKHIPEMIFTEIECCENRDDDIITNDITSNVNDIITNNK